MPIAAVTCIEKGIQVSTNNIATIHHIKFAAAKNSGSKVKIRNPQIAAKPQKKADFIELRFISPEFAS